MEQTKIFKTCSAKNKKIQFAFSGTQSRKTGSVEIFKSLSLKISAFKSLKIRSVGLLHKKDAHKFCAPWESKESFYDPGCSAGIAASSYGSLSAS